jgi:glycosyltransferase involved in cell wall biosynthesis
VNETEATRSYSQEPSRYSGPSVCHIARDIGATGGGEVVKQVSRHMAARGAQVTVITDTRGLDLGPGVRIETTLLGATLLAWVPRTRAGWHARHATQIAVFTLASSFRAGKYRKSGAVIFNHNCESLAGDVLVMHNVFLAELDRRALSLPARLKAMLNPVRSMRIGKEKFLSLPMWRRDFVAVSQAAELDVLSLAGGPERVTVIPNGVDVARFGRVSDVFPPTILSEWTERHDLKHVLFIGHEYKRKGLAELLDAMTLLPDFSLIVVGGASQDHQKYRRDVTSLGIEDRVLFAGEHSDVRAFLAAATVFCLPSHYETMPLVALEALAAGVPIVLSPECPASDLIRPALNGVVAGHSPSEIAQGIRDAANLGHRTGASALIRESVRECDWLPVADQYLEVAGRVATSRGAGRRGLGL